MRMMRMVMGSFVLGAMGAAGCTVKTSGDASRYAEPIPETSDVALSVPGSTAASGASARSATGLRPLGNPPSGPTGPAAGSAAFYQFTRDVADSVDFGTAYILGAVWLIVHTRPTSIDAKHAVWGPGNGNALDPVVWRLTVTEIGTDEFDYVLEGRPHLSTSEADFKTVLNGHGWGVAHPQHRSGSFTIDNDAYASLDPARASRDSGTVAVTFDARTYPITIQANVHHTRDTGSYDVTVTHEKDASGEVDMTALADVDTPADGTLENVDLKSRWATTGAGRADVKISGGSAPGVVLASECWGVDFVRSYYSDSAGYRPTSGDAASCVFPQAPL